MALTAFSFVFLGLSGTASIVAVVMLSVIGSRLILKFGSTAGVFKTARRQVLEKSNGLILFSLLMTIILPVSVALVCKFWLGTTFDAAILIFLGTAYASQIVVNLKMLPLALEEVSTTFS